MPPVFLKANCFLSFGLALFCSAAHAQELTPRAYWPAPVGTDVLILAVQRNTGDVVIDPSLPITGVDSDIRYLQAAYQHAFGWLGRSASIQLSQPYADGETRGMFGGQSLNRNINGLGDTSVRLAINLKGAPAMDSAGFAALRKNPGVIVGASLLVSIPTGAYDKDKLINLGANRWSIKPAIGAIVPLTRTLLLEGELGVRLFGDNDDFVGQTREQEKIVSATVHLVKRIRPGFWASLDANYYRGGEIRVGNLVQEDLQRNSRAGFTVVFPFQKRHAIRGSYSTGVATSSGGDFEIATLSYLYAW